MDSSNLLPPPTRINDVHKHYDVAVSVIVMMILATGISIGRLIIRKNTRSFGNDDWAMIPALGIVATAFIYPAMTAAIRVSILLFYLRIFGKTQSIIKWVIWACLALTAVYVAVFSIIPGLICTPLSATWHILTRKDHCKSDQMYYDYNVALYSASLGMDILLLIIPIYPVMGLRMPLRRRLGALFIFALGTSACVAASYKLAVWVTQWQRTGNIDPSWFKTQMSRVIPPQWDSFGYTFWLPSQVEPTVAIIGSALPAYRQHLFHLYQRISSEVRSFSMGKSSYSMDVSNDNSSTFEFNDRTGRLP
ncbi:hypothetical protein BU24DRAFT_484056 [Aaosphaeria arxii CBS 175.79]|uniref:Rhodopsin domain-containing protein n=1 Tax=Aaosphaeria arxii CBS 175.79 TaxID=1450172 RepID=A0A6A5XHW7_9PLEO|nr:uncharacterized protein BU24DRAFT_484056 [Aaosphaeria arxii CBS 175.79]KAF2012411.1 hypothetical protein BU24DRAFT_484056 [Aaosphaeria arxii CBS 175.79]